MDETVELALVIELDAKCNRVFSIGGVACAATTCVRLLVFI
jgi:hypothetical protein